MSKSVIGIWYPLLLFDYQLQKEKCSIINTLRDTAHQKSSTFAKHLKMFKFLYLQE